ncbi:hypothetical protein TNCV_5104121 [Trichonephila clavipes]|nr:hypothetical protein TNCV_5104121 [Trichonephila clavipes]
MEMSKEGVKAHDVCRSVRKNSWSAVTLYLHLEKISSNFIANKDTVIHEMSSHDKLEAIYIDAWKNGIHFKIVGLYNPPNNMLDLKRIAGISSHRNTIILGDFNVYSTRWGHSNTSAICKAVEELLDNPSLMRIPSRLTFLSYSCHSKTPDLALTHANLSHRSTLSLKDPVDGSGHHIMYLQVHNISPQPKPRKLTRWNFKKARWDRYSLLSDEYVTEDLINYNPDKSADLFVKGILRSAKESISRGQIKKHLPFWNEFLDLLKSERNAARCRAENSHNIADCILLRKAQSKQKRAIILFKRTTNGSFISNLDFRKDGPRGAQVRISP